MAQPRKTSGNPAVRARPKATPTSDSGKNHPQPRTTTGHGPSVASRWTRPQDGSPYPLTLAGEFDGPPDMTTRLTAAIFAVLVLVAYAIVVPVINTAIIYLGYVVESPGVGWAAYSAGANDFTTVWGVLGAHLSLACMILVVWAFFRFIHHRPLVWLWSVSPGPRWRYGILCLIASLVLMGAYATYQGLTGGQGWDLIHGWGWYLVVIVVATPFQALAEEVLFRGYLMQALGSVVRNVWFPIIGSAVVFAIFHGLQNPWLFGSRLAFGILAGILVWRTGGLEAGVAIHVMNNICAFGLALATGTISQLRTTTAVPWVQGVSDTASFAVCAVACWGIAVGLKVPMRVKLGAARTAGARI